MFSPQDHAHVVLEGQNRDRLLENVRSQGHLLESGQNQDRLLESGQSQGHPLESGQGHPPENDQNHLAERDRDQGHLAERDRDQGHLGESDQGHPPEGDQNLPAEDDQDHQPHGDHGQGHVAEKDPDQGHQLGKGHAQDHLEGGAQDQEAQNPVAIVQGLQDLEGTNYMYVVVWVSQTQILVHKRADDYAIWYCNTCRETFIVL